MARYPAPDPHEEWQPIGDVLPENGAMLKRSVVDALHERVRRWREGTPDDHEIISEIDGEEVEVESIKVHLSEKATEYSVKAIRGAKEHKKEIAATVTVAGLIGVIAGMHVRRKQKK